MLQSLKVLRQFTLYNTIIISGDTELFVIKFINNYYNFKVCFWPCLCTVQI